MRDTEYAREIASAEIRGCRIERLFVKSENQEEIRFSWWPDGRMANRPLDLPEAELLSLLTEAMRQSVFSPEFLRDLRSILNEQET